MLDKLKFYISFPELRGLHIDKKAMNSILNDEQFKKRYKSNCSKFMGILRRFEMKNSVFDENSSKLDESVIMNHLTNLVELSHSGNEKKYIDFVEKNLSFQDKLPWQCFADINFGKMYVLIKEKIFLPSVIEIIKNGYSDRLVYFLENKILELKYLENINNDFFSDKFWQIVVSNPKICDKPVLEMFHSNFTSLVNLVNNDYFDGMKLIYEMVPESRRVLVLNNAENDIGMKLFSKKIIEGIGIEFLKQQYERGMLGRCSIEDTKKILGIADCGNFDLIKDALTFDSFFHFSIIPDEDFEKDIVECKTGYQKKDLLLSKIFSIDFLEISFVKVFLKTINKADLSVEFNHRYNEILNLFDRILNSNDKELIEISKRFDGVDKEKYKQLVIRFEKDANDILKVQFAADLRNREKVMLSNCPHQKIIVEGTDKEIDVYEFTGQPFTMLVHNVNRNKLSSNNDVADQLIYNPEIWDMELQRNNFISTSLINDNHMNVYGCISGEGEDESVVSVTYGFSELPGSIIKSTDSGDSGTDRDNAENTDFNMRNRCVRTPVNTITTIDNLMENTKSNEWNEVVFSRKIGDKKVRPNYLVCKDNINEHTIKAALYFNVPIYLIHSNSYGEKSESLESAKTI